MSNLGGAQPTVRRHLQFVADLPNGFDQQTLVGLTGNDRRPQVATGNPSATVIQQQVSANRVTVGRMTFQAAVNQQGTNVLFEVGNLLLRLVRASRTATQGK
jgi:hypothetical protein